MAAAQTAAAKPAEQPADVKATEAQTAAAKPAKSAPVKPSLVVLGPVAVLPLVGGGERYVYRGAPVGDEYTKEGVKHAQAVGLVGKPKK